MYFRVFLSKIWDEESDWDLTILDKHLFQTLFI